MGPKIKIFNKGDKAFILSPFDSSRKNKQIKYTCQNRVINGRVICPLEGRAPKWQLAYFGLNGGNFGHIFRY